jgi:CTP synthase
VNIALVGKYMRLLDSYKSVVEALAHGAIANELEINLVKVEASSDNVVEQLKGVHGIVVPGGFGYRGIEGKIEAIKYSRENNIPFLGLCVGLQTAVIEFARNVCELEGANSTEFDPQTPYPVVDIMEEQKKINYLGGTMRLGTYQCRLNSGSLAFRVYSREIIHERHRHRYEFNDRYLEIFEKRGMLATGFDTKTKLVEVMENKNHPFFIGVQYHPEFLSKPTSPHPLFAAFVNSAYKYKLENGRY